MVINYNKTYGRELWPVQYFVDELENEIRWAMEGQSIQKPFTNKAELKQYCMDHQPYYKKYIPEVVQHFAQKYNIK